MQSRTPTVFRFDGGDLMPAAMKAAFFTAMVDYAENPRNLDTILAEPRRGPGRRAYAPAP